MKNSIEIKAIPALKDNYIWALVDKEQASVLIVDPGDATPVYKFLEEENLSLAGILITHHHWDHTQGVGALKEHFKVPVLGPRAEKVVGVDQGLGEGDEASVNNFPLRFSVMDIPGHTLGHLAYYGSGSLFCGDTLFAAGCGRIFEGSAEQMYQSLQKLAACRAETKVYCAHEYTLNNLRFAQVVEPNNLCIPERIEKVNALRKEGFPSLPSLLAEEIKTNPFLRCESPELIANVENFSGKRLSTSVEVFASLRKWKDGF